MRIFLVIFLALATLSPGARLDFVGLRSYNDDDLEELIAGRLDYILKREATEYRADDAAYLVETFLRSHGLPDARVSGRAIPPKTIRLTVDEGLAQFLGPITVIGYDQEEEIIEQFQAPFPESGERRAFQASAIEAGLGRVRDLLHADAYWEGEVTATRGTRNAQGEIPFTLRVTPGPQFTLAKPNLETPVPPTPDLSTKIGNEIGKPATAETINAIRSTIWNSYLERGYNDISLSMSRELAGTRLRLFFTISPGEKFMIRSIRIEGLNKTRPDRITARFDDLTGQTYDEKLINERVKQLLTTGAFEGIRLDSNDAGDNKLDLTLHLKEGDARGFSFAVGYGSIEGYVLGARYYDRNLWGRLWNLSAGLELTGLGGLGEVSLSNPFFLNRNLNLANRAYLIRRDFDNYRKLEGGLGTELSWRYGEKKRFSSTLGLETSHVSVTSSLPDELIGPDNYLVNQLRSRTTYDLRDDPALPSDGFFARIENTLGFATGDGGIGFFETRGQLSFYHTFKNFEGAVALGLRGGIILPSGDDDDLPIDLRQFLGGANTIRSFPELEMGPSFDNKALGGTTWWVANAEYTRSIAGPVKGLLFVDAAQLDSETDLAVGLGVRVDLPVGPIRLEYGHSLSRDPGEPAGAFHFAIGTTF